ncbi:MAG: dethiobiotin synthase [Raineya sp.]
MPHQYFITAIGTDSGKTLVSAIFTQALQADYWKPVQSGLPKDADTIRQLVDFPVCIHNSAYEFTKPASPHDAAKAENRQIDLAQIQMPKTSNHLIVEGAGGLLVPLNAKDFVADIIQKFDLEVILVINFYLGCINHSLLSIQELKRRNLRVKGIVFNGEPNEESQSIILHHSGYECLLHIYPEKAIENKVIKKYASLLLEKLENLSIIA